MEVQHDASSSLASTATPIAAPAAREPIANADLAARIPRLSQSSWEGRPGRAECSATQRCRFKVETLPLYPAMTWWRRRHFALLRCFVGSDSAQLGINRLKLCLQLLLLRVNRFVDAIEAVTFGAGTLQRGEGRLLLLQDRGCSFL